MKQSKKIIGFFRPCDLLTMSGTLCTFVGILLLLNQHFTYAVLFLMLSGLCDGFDGTLARKKKYDDSQKTYGVQLDSLSDVICFGVFPALITATLSPHIISYIICALYMLCGVIRLAYFNMLDITKKAKKGIFIGMPITSISIIYPIIYIITIVIDFNYLKYVLPVVLLITGILFIYRKEYPKPNIPKIFNKLFNKYLVNYLLFPLFLLLGSNLIFILNNYAPVESISMLISTTIHHIGPFIFIFLLILLLFITLSFIMGNTKRSKITLIVIFGILVLINDIKFNIMGIPLEISDVDYLKPSSMEMMGIATTSIGPWIFKTIIKTIIFVIICLTTLLRNIEYKYNIKKRLLLITTFLILNILIFMLLIKNNIFVINNIYRTTQEEINQNVSANNIYVEYGYYQGLLLNALSKTNYTNNPPEGYDKSIVLKELEKYKNVEENIWGKANVVFLLSESFSDMSKISNTTFDKDLTPNITKYSKDKDKMVFDFISPTFGGCTVNTEFEVLTGGSINYFAPGFIPWTQYYNNDNGELSPSLIREFNNNGYTTMYITPWKKDLYKSGYVYTLFGTDKKKYLEELKGNYKGIYYSDESFINDIFNELKDTKDNNYKFIFGATAQNHYPYSKDKYDNYDINIKETSLKGEDKDIMLNYAQGIYDADKELGNLYEKIKTLKTPTIVVFFGDHLPYTTDSKGYDPYLSDDYFNTDNTNVNELRKYTTKAVILSNFDLKTEKITSMNASFLGAYVLNKMDLKISDYFKYIANSEKIAPAYNRNSILVDDKVINYLGDKEKAEQIKNLNYVQYYSFYDSIK